MDGGRIRWGVGVGGRGDGGEGVVLERWVVGWKGDGCLFIFFSLWATPGTPLFV